MWKDEIKKFSRKSYHPVYSKSKYWGSKGSVPNEFDNYVTHIINMSGKERSDVEVQKDIKYIKETMNRVIEKYQRYLDKLNKIPMDGSDTDDEDLEFDGLGSLFS
tara:strand:+ start:1298 stop:1612 length:315 start_codon:yes stop_codon:yes gene_type:complete